MFYSLQIGTIESLLHIGLFYPLAISGIEMVLISILPNPAVQDHSFNIDWMKASRIPFALNNGTLIYL